MTKVFISFITFPNAGGGKSIYVLPCVYGKENGSYIAGASRICICPNGVLNPAGSGTTNYKLNIYKEPAYGLQRNCVE